MLVYNINNMFLGSQVKSEKTDISLLDGIKDVSLKGGNVVQIFLRKMYSSSNKDKIIISNEEKIKIRKFIKNKEILGFVHGSYLLNFCKFPVGSKRIEWAYKILKEDMILGNELEMKGVVIHMCSRKTINNNKKIVIMSIKETIKRNIDHLDYFLQKNKLKTQLILENSSSEGYKIGGTLEEFGKVFKPLRKKYKSKIGTCIDTCHAFASGYPLNTVLGMSNFLEEYKKKVGPYSTISLIHLNDSQNELGSRKDRHLTIGKGYIFKKKEGKEALSYLISFSIKHKIPMCLETKSGYVKEFSLINKLNLKTTSPILKIDILNILNQFYEYHKSLGNNIKSNQYAKAYKSLKSSSIENIKSGNDLLHLSWFGKGITNKIEEYIKTGKIKLLEEFKKNPLVISSKELTSIFGIGPKKAKSLIEKGIYNINDLKKELKKNSIKLTKQQKIGLKYHNDLIKRIPRKESEKIRKLIENEFKFLYGKNSKAILAGSYRMGAETSGDVDILLYSKDIKNINGILNEFINYLIEKNIIKDTFSGKNNKYMGIIKIENNPFRHIDLHLITKENLPFHMLYFSSGEYFSRKIRKEAKNKGYILNDKGLFKKDNKKRIKSVKTEKNVFKKLKMNWVPPENRLQIT